MRKYDTEPPLWVKYGSIPVAVLTFLGLPLSYATSPGLARSAVVAVVVLYLVVLLTWVRKHRV